jgi:carboxymethylenebutenolidase
VTFAANGHGGQGYLSLPASGTGPGVVVIQEWWGLNDNIRAIADRFAVEGFVALAPDLYHGKRAREPDEAGKLMMALNADTAARDLSGAIDCLLTSGATGLKVGTVGFCMGGALAIYAGTVVPEKVGAVVDFYGGHPHLRPDLTRLAAPLLGLFAENDGFVTPAVVQTLASQLKGLGKSVEVHIYPGTDHAFFNDTRPEVYAADAAANAWQRTLAFFRTHLAAA